MNNLKAILNRWLFYFPNNEMNRDRGFNPGKYPFLEHHDSYNGDGGPIAHLLGVGFIGLILVMSLWIVFFKKKKNK